MTGSKVVPDPAAFQVERLRSTYSHRSSGSAHAGLVFCLATPVDRGGGIAVQARSVFTKLDAALAALGSDRHQLLQATIYLADPKDEPGFEAEWKAWLGDDPASWPTRAGIGAILSPGLLCEVVVIAAQTQAARVA